MQSRTIRRVLVAIVMLSALLLSAVSAAVIEDLPAAESSGVSIYLVSHGWHAGIVLERQYLAQHLTLLQNDFADVDYLEIGWGDSEFYQTPEPHFGHILKAGLLPSESVLHLVGFNGRVEHYFPYSEIIEIRLLPAQLKSLSQHIADSFAVNHSGAVEDTLGPGLYGDSRFYRSRESYHIFNTCNVWSARALLQAGLDMQPALALSVDDLMGQLKEQGTVIQQLRSIGDSMGDKRD